MQRTEHVEGVRLVDSAVDAGQPAGLTAPDDREALDAYSQVVTHAVELLTPSVASLRIRHRTGRGVAEGGGSALAITPDGYLLTSAHVVDSPGKGSARFPDGSRFDIEVVGSD